MIGPNGAGKTTVFNLLSGFLSPDKGAVSMMDARGNWVSCSTPDEFAHQGLGRTFQIAKPFTGLTVLENIMLGAFIRLSLIHISDVAEAAIAAAGGETAAPRRPASPLSQRELEVLRQISLGASNKEAARALNISPSTVRTHVESVFRKLECSTRAAATLKALTSGLL